MTPKNGITLRSALTFIRNRDGKIFAVRFVKRTTGELREMVCRQGVKTHLVAEPSKPGVDFKANDLIPVYDMRINGYRSVPIEGITEIKVDGEWLAVVRV